MRLTIFGASGRTGLLLVEQALAAGHAVTGFVRDPTRLTLRHERLTLVQGDATDPAPVGRAIEGADAVVSALGPVRGGPKAILAAATPHMLAAMARHGVRRLVSLTGAGVAAPEDRPKLMNHLIKFALTTLAGDVLRDGEEHARLIQASGLDWVIVRAPVLSDGPYTGRYRVGWVGINTGARISRADLAAFMLTQVTDPTYLHRMPMVSE
jgi:putative NADH-flavin reductase